MKKFIIQFFKVFPWVLLIVGVVSIIVNPPRNELYDEDIVVAGLMLLSILVSFCVLIGLSYVVEAACLYLEKNKAKE